MVFRISEHDRKRTPRCIVVAGPNGAGKTTFAREFLPTHANILHFINADLIAGGLSPLRPEMAAIQAGRLLVAEIDRISGNRADFAFESTLSGVRHAVRLKQWKERGYRIEIIYLTLPSIEVALKRITLRVRQGGHAVPAADVARRFRRSWDNFERVYRPIADAWLVYDNSGDRPVLIAEGP